MKLIVILIYLGNCPSNELLSVGKRNEHTFVACACHQA